ncbi:MAG: metallophosphoesterase family protein [Nitrospiraceae bacterium]
MKAYLLAHLHTIAPSISQTNITISQTIITGDLCQNPTRADAVSFRNFRAALYRLTGKDPIVIPGNHDQKWLGNIRSHLRELANLEWSNLVIDTDSQCVFLCFDSARGADMARGQVTAEQLMDVATQYETACVANPLVRTYVPVVLLHHHPLSFETGPETRIQRVLGRFGLTD